MRRLFLGGDDEYRLHSARPEEECIRGIDSSGRRIDGAHQPVSWSLSALTGAERTLRLAGLPLMVMGSLVKGLTP